MNSQYETLYGVGLLDDLHNYFPAILYEPQSFHSVAGLLRYVQQQTRNRFDLFSLGQREYRSLHPQQMVGRVADVHVPLPASPPPPPAPVRASVGEESNEETNNNPPDALPPRVVSSVQVHTTSIDLSGNPVAANSTLQSSIRRTLGGFLAGSPMGNSLHYTFNLAADDDEEEESRLTTQLLATLLQLPQARRGIPLPESFLQPVPVVPTQEQIDANTTVGNLVSDTENTCAICQDTLEAEQEGRKLNACGHWFHKNCIDTWLSGNVHCPVCRHDIREATTSEASEATP